MKRRPTDSNTEGKKDTGMLKYIRNQVSKANDLMLEVTRVELLQTIKSNVVFMWRMQSHPSFLWCWEK